MDDGARKTKGAVSARRVMGVLVAALLAWAAFVPAYNAWRAPKSVFAEIYWSGVDADSARAAFCEAGLCWPGEFLFAFLNPLRETGLSDMGAYREMRLGMASLTRWENGDRIDEELNGPPSVRFSLFYGRHYYTLDSQRKIGTGATATAEEITISSQEDRNTVEKQGDVVIFRINLKVQDDLESGTPLKASAWFRYYLSEGAMDVEVEYMDGLQPYEVRRAAESILLDDFLSDYFEANPGGRFSAADMGEWEWGEAEYENWGEVEPFYGL